MRDCLATGQGRGQCVHGGELCLAFVSKVAHGDSRFAETRRQLREFHIKPLAPQPCPAEPPRARANHLQTKSANEIREMEGSERRSSDPTEGRKPHGHGRGVTIWICSVFSVPHFKTSAVVQPTGR